MPDDNTALVDRLTSETPSRHSEARFVPLHKLGSPAEAEMVNDILNAKRNSLGSQVGRCRAFSPLFSAQPKAQ